MIRLPSTAPELAFRPDVTFARETLASYEPKDAEQARQRAAMLAFLDEFPETGHLRSCVPGHLTASSLIVHPDRKRGLFTHHRKLNRWLQLGGHCDGDANLAAVALREAIEESGIADLVIEPTPVDLDIHSIPARKADPEHLHLDTRFLIFAPEGAEYVVSDESHDLAWLTLDELADCADGSVLRLARLVLG